LEDQWSNIYQRALLIASLGLETQRDSQYDNMIRVLDGIGTNLYNQLQSLINMKAPQGRAKKGLKSLFQRKEKEQEQGKQLTVPDGKGGFMIVEMMD